MLDVNYNIGKAKQANVVGHHRDAASSAHLVFSVDIMKLPGCVSIASTIHCMW